MSNWNNYRENTPGLPNLFTGEGYKDPLAINLHNVLNHLVGWMTIEELCASMRITTYQARTHLVKFLIDEGFTSSKENGVEKWSNSSGITLSKSPNP